MAATKTKARPAASASAVKNKKARLLSSQIAYKGKVFSVYTDQVEEPGGVINTRDVIRHNGSVVILALDESVETGNPKDPIVIFERHYRHAAGQFLLQLPPARIEP